MFNGVQYVRDLCQQRKIPISQLEKECGFSNGYLNPKKLTKIPYERAVVIANYLGISSDLILNGEDAEKAPAESGKCPVTDDDIKFALFGGDGEITDAMYQEVKEFAALIKLREAMKKQKE